MTTINIVGAGAYGTALAVAAQEKSKDVTVWSYDISADFTIVDHRYHSRRLKSTILPQGICVTDQLSEVADADIILLAPPAQKMRSVLENLKPYLSQNTYMVACSKGIENETCQFMTEVIKDVLPSQPAAVLSGPSFATELVHQKPTAVTVAAQDLTTAQWLCQSLGSSFFRTYASDDRLGVQLGGATKNVIAIAAGILEAKTLGENARALLITRGLAEIVRLGVALGAKAETFQGLSGMGDLWLTCVSGTSRNWSFGYQLGSGDVLTNLVNQAQHAIEGVHTAQAVLELAQKHDVRMPICEAINALINQDSDLNSTISSLMYRESHSYIEIER